MSLEGKRMWWIRLLNRLRLRSDEMLCMHQEDTWHWPSHLGKRTEGKCSKCGEPIYFEKQNKPFRKVCNRCGIIGVTNGPQKVS